MPVISTAIKALNPSRRKSKLSPSSGTHVTVWVMIWWSHTVWSWLATHTSPAAGPTAQARKTFRPSGRPNNAMTRLKTAKPISRPVTGKPHSEHRRDRHRTSEPLRVAHNEVEPTHADGAVTAN